MARMVMNPKEDVFEKQTYSIFDAELGFNTCTSCGKINLTNGYFCQIHKCLFCIDCAMSQNEKRIIKCKDITIGNPIFVNKGLSATQCVYVPIKEITIKGEK